MADMKLFSTKEGVIFGPAGDSCHFSSKSILGTGIDKRVHSTIYSFLSNNISLSKKKFDILRYSQLLLPLYSRVNNKTYSLNKPQLKNRFAIEKDTRLSAPFNNFYKDKSLQVNFHKDNR